MSDWRANLIDEDAELAAILHETTRIAVLGMKTEAQAGQPAFYVPRYMAEAGYEIGPVPVYYPEVYEILGEPVYRKLADIPDPVDMVNLFRRPHHIPPHVPDLLAARPRAVWMQLGISHDGVAETLARAGIKVVQDR